MDEEGILSEDEAQVSRESDSQHYGAEGKPLSDDDAPSRDVSPIIKQNYKQHPP